MNNVFKVLNLTVLLCVLPHISWAYEPRSVDWFRNPQNKIALEEKLEQCRQMSHANSKAAEECNNAKLVDIHGEKFQPVREPTFGFGK